MRSLKKTSHGKKQNQRFHDACVASSFLNVELFPHSGKKVRSDAIQTKFLTMKKSWHAILPCSVMILDLLLFLLALVLGYAIFMSSAYLLAKWMLPKIEDDHDFAYPESGERHVRQTVKHG